MRPDELAETHHAPLNAFAQHREHGLLRPEPPRDRDQCSRRVDVPQWTCIERHERPRGAPHVDVSRTSRLGVVGHYDEHVSFDESSCLQSEVGAGVNVVECRLGPGVQQGGHLRLSPRRPVGCGEGDAGKHHAPSPLRQPVVYRATRQPVRKRLPARQNPILMVEERTKALIRHAPSVEPTSNALSA
jgi:hypothetical protein